MLDEHGWEGAQLPHQKKEQPNQKKKHHDQKNKLIRISKLSYVLLDWSCVPLCVFFVMVLFFLVGLLLFLVRALCPHKKGQAGPKIAQDGPKMDPKRAAAHRVNRARYFLEPSWAHLGPLQAFKKQ